MLEPSGHCPYLGLKQNQAIRFASPTPEHRCYASGQAQDIPSPAMEYQVRYCLSAAHIRCPLYTGSGLPSTPSLSAGAAALNITKPPQGLRGWFVALSPRDRVIYIGLLLLLVCIFIVYSIAGINLLRTNGFFGQDLSPSPQPSVPVVVEATHTPSPTMTVVTPTSSPTHTATVTSTPTVLPSPLPTATYMPEPTLPPTFTPVPTFTNTPAPLVPIWPTLEPPTLTSELLTATSELPTPTPELPTLTPELPTATPELPTVPPDLPTEMPPPARTPDPQPPPTEEYQF